MGPSQMLYNNLGKWYQFHILHLVLGFNILKSPADLLNKIYLPAMLLCWKEIIYIHVIHHPISHQLFHNFTCSWCQTDWSVIISFFPAFLLEYRKYICFLPVFAFFQQSYFLFFYLSSFAHPVYSLMIGKHSLFICPFSAGSHFIFSDTA